MLAASAECPIWVTYGWGLKCLWQWQWHCSTSLSPLLLEAVQRLRDQTKIPLLNLLSSPEYPINKTQLKQTQTHTTKCFCCILSSPTCIRQQALTQHLLLPTEYPLPTTAAVSSYEERRVETFVVFSTEALRRPDIQYYSC